MGPHEGAPPINSSPNGPNTANQKRVIALHKLHVDAAAFTESIHGGHSIKLTVGERFFEDTFIELLCRVVVVKKGVSQIDQIVKFVSAYVFYLNLKGQEIKKEDDNDDDDATSARFVARLLKFLLEGFVAKDKIVRYRCVHLLTGMLCGPEDPSDVEDVLFHTLSCDPAAEVRRAVLLNMHHILPAILARSRDTDTCTTSNGSATGPRVLTIAQRELIIRNGLGDREPAVRAAAGSLLGAWVDVVKGATKPEEGSAVMGDFIAFLALFDLAEDALLSIFATRIDISTNSSSSTASPPMTKLQATLPVVTHRIQSMYNKYQEDLDSVSQERALRALDTKERDVDERLDDLLLDAEFVIAEMLKLAVNLDYFLVGMRLGGERCFSSSAIWSGRRGCPRSCLDVLRVLSPSERDLIRAVVEVVHELRDEGQEEEEEGEGAKEGEADPSPSAVTAVTAAKAPKPPKELTPEEQARADALDIRCLSLCIGMLERVNSTFEENSTLEGILGELIVPAVKRKELALREKGLVCLRLCCLIARRMALNSFQLFLSQVQSSPEVLKTHVLHIMFDMLMVHEGDFLGRGGIGSERIVEFLLHVLNGEDAETVQALLCVGLAEVGLTHMISDERVLKSLVVAYLSPDTAENQALRQCLAYFFPVYCYSSSVNQNRLRQVSVPIFEQLAEATRGLDDDQEIVSPAQITGMFVDWTDPQKAIEVQGQTIDDGAHLDLAEDILKALFNDDMPKDDKKVLRQVLGRVYLSETVDDDKIRTLTLLVHNVFTRRPIRDVSARNALTKFNASISRKYADKLTGFSEEEVDMAKTRGRKRCVRGVCRSESVMTEATVSSVADDGSVGSGKGKARATSSKRRRVSGEDDDDDDDDELPEGRVPPAPTRTLPRRAASVKKAMPVQNITDDDGEDGEEEATPAPKRKARARARAPEPESGSSGNATFDSIMDEEEEEEEEEEVLSLVRAE
ncbi:hypothetical protein OG21DRAFT_1479489 [Imleria badia]|nr:hypothetical protein OG21DRAFT_1479489 [Imleria badia]